MHIGFTLYRVKIRNKFIEACFRYAATTEQLIGLNQIYLRYEATGGHLTYVLYCINELRSQANKLIHAARPSTFVSPGIFAMQSAIQDFDYNGCLRLHFSPLITRKLTQRSCYVADGHLGSSGQQSYLLISRLPLLCNIQ